MKENTSQFIRWSGGTAIVTGIFGIIAALGTGESAPWIYTVSNIATEIALIGICLSQRESAAVLPGAPNLPRYRPAISTPSPPNKEQFVGDWGFS